MRSELLDSLGYLGRLAARADVVPILFGTGVLEFHGIGDFRAADLDVIIDVDGARALAGAAGVDAGGASGNDRFRSRVHLHLDGAPLIIDVMAEMEVATAQGWTLYEVRETVEMEANGCKFRAASLDDLRRFYGLAGREKDRAKIVLLDAALR
jgi:hypothetical protein